MDAQHTVALLARLPTLVAAPLPLAPHAPAAGPAPGSPAPQAGPGAWETEGAGEDVAGVQVRRGAGERGARTHRLAASAEQRPERAASLVRLTVLPCAPAPPQAFARELATVLQLQLPYLPPASLAGVVYSVGEMGAAPAPAWVGTARIACLKAASRCVQRHVRGMAWVAAGCGRYPSLGWLVRARRQAPWTAQQAFPLCASTTRPPALRMSPLQLAVTARGLAGLGAALPPSWVAHFWASSAAHMAEGRLAQLPHLATVVEAVAQLQAQGLLAAGPAGGEAAKQEGHAAAPAGGQGSLAGAPGRAGGEGTAGAVGAGGAEGGVPREWAWLVRVSAAAAAASCGVAPPAALELELAQWQAQHQHQEQAQAQQGEHAATAAGAAGGAGEGEGEQATAAAAPGDGAQAAASGGDAAAGAQQAQERARPSSPPGLRLDVADGGGGVDARAAVRFVVACHAAGLGLDAEWVVRLLAHATAAPPPPPQQHDQQRAGV